LPPDLFRQEPRIVRRHAIRHIGSPRAGKDASSLEWNPETQHVAYIYGDQSVYWYAAILLTGLIAACVARLDAGGRRIRQLAFFVSLLLVSLLTGALLLARHEAWSIAGLTLGMMTVIAVWDAKPALQTEFS
jgi:hypothetical protein